MATMTRVAFGLRLTLTALALLAALALPACGPGKTSDDDVIVIKEEQLDQMMAEKHTVLIDVRGPEWYAAGHIPGAINIPLPEIKPKDVRLAEAKVIIVYASRWTDPLSRAAAKSLFRRGYKNIYEFKGGIDLWERLDRSVVVSLPRDAGRPDTDR